MWLWEVQSWIPLMWSRLWVYYTQRIMEGVDVVGTHISNYVFLIHILKIRLSGMSTLLKWQVQLISPDLFPIESLPILFIMLFSHIFHFVSFGTFSCITSKCLDFSKNSVSAIKELISSNNIFPENSFVKSLFD